MFIESFRASVLREDVGSVKTRKSNFHGLSRPDINFAKLETIPPPTKTKVVSEQLFPSEESRNILGRSILHREVHNQDLNIRVLLLSPRPSDAPPFQKSVADLYSRYGSINVEVIKLFGAEQHFFRLHVTSCERSVKVLLPTGFRGVVCVDRYRNARIKYCTGILAGIKAGLIRLDATDPAGNEDEVHIHSPGEIELRMMDEAGLHPGPVVWYSSENGIQRVSRMLRIAG